MNFLFWNVAKCSLNNAIVRIVQSTQTNILVLAEYDDDEYTLLKDLHKVGINYFVLPTIGCTKIKVFTDIEPDCFRFKRESDRYSIRQFSKNGYESILLALVHLPSKLFMSEYDQFQYASYFRDEIEIAEAESENSNTLIIGDFNMNPFEAGMISARAMHSLPCLRTAKRGARVIQGRTHSFFYNPTWNLFGDLEGVPGTYYYSSSSYQLFYWNMLDQVILRPTIADRLDRRSLKIITSAGELSLLNNYGHPSISDHLPIFFTINLSIGGKHEEPMA